MRRVPLNITDTALLGGLDLGATLQAGKPVGLKGVLAQSDGGIVLLAMAERMAAGAAARFCAVMDTREVAMERDGLGTRSPARIGVVALDEGASDDERLPAALMERLAFSLVLEEAGEEEDHLEWSHEEVTKARALLPRVRADDAVVRALCAAAQALGVDSLRASLFALQVARVAAALAGCDAVKEEHSALAARLVLAPRATRVPPPPPEPPSADEAPQEGSPPDQPDEPPAPADPPPPRGEAATEQDAPAPPQDDTAQMPDTDGGSEMGERVLEAAQAAIPAGLLAALKVAEGSRSKAPSAGRAGAAQKSQLRGRPIGARRGEPRAGQRLNVIETLRAAAPWQRLRQGQQGAESGTQDGKRRIQVRKDDFHVSRFRQLGQTTTVFVVDASGSSALNRLAEAKGAVELLLADCYVRRDSVAVLAFRGKETEMLLPPTRSLARAKRSLAGLPGGGGTPLASGIDSARALGDQIRRKGETPLIVLLTDGRGNISRDGKPGRAQAAQDAMRAAQELRSSGMTSLLMDISPQPQPQAQLLAREMGATYVPLPYAGAQALSQAVRAVAALSAKAR